MKILKYLLDLQVERSGVLLFRKEVWAEVINLEVINM